MQIVTQVVLLATLYGLVGSGFAQLNYCGSIKFQCKDGQCINEELLCNGKADCTDQSDETELECTKPENQCPYYKFRCNYGACVDGDASCNGIKDCLDNSDETSPLCTSTPSEIAIDAQCELNEFQCDNGQCINNTEVCDGIANCTDSSDETVATCGWLTCPSTKFHCAYGACIDNSLRCNRVQNCADGSDETAELCGWTSTQETYPKSHSACGILPLLSEQKKDLDLPWHALLFLKNNNGEKRYICDATIITEKLLITAAHCVYQEYYNKAINASKVYVVAGSTIKKYDSPLHNHYVSKNRVKTIYIACNYLGRVANYIWDIAILELEEPFELTTWLLPACLDFTEHSDSHVLKEGAYGKTMANYQDTKMDTNKTTEAERAQNNPMKPVSISYIPYHQCRPAIQNTELRKTTIDKFCASYSNGSQCISGSGIVFKTQDIWYLRGISSISLSVTATEKFCDYVLFTRISSYIAWISEIMLTVAQNRTYPTCPDQNNH